MAQDVVVVLGVGGMGQALIRRLGSGRALLIADANEAVLNTAAQELIGNGHRVTHQLVDVGQASSMRALATAAADLGPVMKVVHTAGLSPVQASAEAVLRVDLLGVALMLDEFSRIVSVGGSGLIISSAAGYVPLPLTPDQEKDLATAPADELLDLPWVREFVGTSSELAYVLAKRANHLRVQAAAPLWGARGARINSLSPGTISTPMALDELAGPHGERMRAGIKESPARRIGTPDDIAAAGAFLLSPDADFITGVDLLVDGGGVAAGRWPGRAG